MLNRNKDILIALVYSMVSLAYVALFETFVFDDSYDSFVNNISIGQFTPFPMMQQHYLSALVSRDVLIFLQKLFPDWSIFASSYIAFNVLSLLVTIYTVQKYLLKNSPSWLKHPIAIILCLIFLENIVSITHTRFATILCGLALMNLLRPNAKQWFWVALFVFGMLMRPESGIGAMVIIGLGALIFEGKVLTLGIKWKFPILSLAILISVFFIHRNVTDRFEILMEPDIEYALSTQRVADLSEMTSREDSIKHTMATHGILIDQSFTDIGFLRSISQKQFALDFQNLGKSVIHVLSFFAYYPFYLVFMLVVWIGSPQHYRGKMILYYLTIALILSYLDYNIALSDRHYSSIQLIAMLWPLKLGVQDSIIKRTLFVLGLSLALLTAAVITCDNTLANQRDIAVEVECIQTAMTNFESVYQDREVMIGVSSFHLLDRKYSTRTDAYSKNNYSLYDAMNYSIVPVNMTYLGELCNCDASDTQTFFSWLAQSEALILMDKERKSVIQEYLDYKYAKRYTLELDVDYEQLITPVCVSDLSINDYYPWIVKVN